MKDLNQQALLQWGLWGEHFEREKYRTKTKKSVFFAISIEINNFA